MRVICYKSFHVLYVGVSFTAEQLSYLFSLSATDVEMEILTLQNDINLKAHQSAPNFWCLVDKEKYSGVCTAAMKIASFFGSTYLCESAFSNMNFIKNKHRTRLTDAHLQDSLRIAVSNYSPDYNALVSSMQCQASHFLKNDLTNQTFFSFKEQQYSSEILHIMLNVQKAFVSFLMEISVVSSV